MLHFASRSSMQNLSNVDTCFATLLSLRFGHILRHFTSCKSTYYCMQIFSCILTHIASDVTAVSRFRFRTEQGHCGACRRKWQLTDTDLCPCGKTQTMSHIVESCPLTKLNCSLSQLHSADEDAVSWLTSYGS